MNSHHPLPGVPDGKNAAGRSGRDSAHVLILMAVHEGARTLDEQLESIAAQTHRNWSLLVSVDGASDGSDRLVDAFAARMAPAGIPVRRIDGPRRGATQNFLHLTAEAPRVAVEMLGPERAGNIWLAFSDQDDVWLPDKLSTGVGLLTRQEDSAPRLYCSRTWVTDARLENRRLSVARPRPPSFANALVQNIVAGNTIVLDPAGARQVCAAAREAMAAGVPAVAHDWWIYQLMAGSGATIVHDDRPSLYYRQHGGNEVGANDGFRAKLRRIGMILDGTYRDWNRRNVRVLRASAHRLQPAFREGLEEFASALGAPLPRRIRKLRGLGIYRQGRLSHLALWVAAVMGRL